MTIDFVRVYAAFKLLDPQGIVVANTSTVNKLLHFVPPEVTRERYEPYCELLRSFGLAWPTPADARLGFYVHHYVPPDMAVPDGPWRRKLPREYLDLMENVSRLQEWYGLDYLKMNALEGANKRANISPITTGMWTDKHQERWNDLFHDPFVQKWK